MVRERNGRFVLRERLPGGMEILDYDEPDEPLAPEKYDLEEYNGVERKVRQTRGYINVLIDDAERERANESHQMLTDLVASKIRQAGSIPKRNRYIDLSALLREEFYLFEMKSTTDSNMHGQIRRAVSQLYEYRYLQQLPSAKLVIVIENPPPAEKKWIVDYLVRDRNLLIAWDGDGKTLKFPNEIAADLRFLA